MWRTTKVRTNHWGFLVASFHRVGDELNGTIGHQDVDTTLVTTTWWAGSHVVVPVSFTHFRVWRTNGVHTGHGHCTPCPVHTTACFTLHQTTRRSTVGVAILAPELRLFSADVASLNTFHWVGFNDPASNNSSECTSLIHVAEVGDDFTRCNGVCKAIEDVTELGISLTREDTTIRCGKPFRTPVVRCWLKVMFLRSVIPDLSPRVTQADCVVRASATGESYTWIAWAAISWDFGDPWNEPT